MLPTFVIGLREGLEAALIVGIVAAFLRQRGRLDLLKLVWLGVGIAIALCLAVGIVLKLVSTDLPTRQQEGLETVIALVAVSMVTYMVIWMRRNSRGLKKQLEGAADAALLAGSGGALVAMAFLAVLREGFETAVFLLAAFNQSSSPIDSGIGAALGIAVAVALGYGIYRGGVRINLSKFFRATGLVLVLVAAGLVVSAAHTAHEAGWLNIGQGRTFDMSWLVRPGSVQASLLTGMLGWQPRPVTIELIVWLLYLVPIGLYVAWPAGRRAPARMTAVVGLVGALACAAAALVLVAVAPGASKPAGPQQLATSTRSSGLLAVGSGGATSGTVEVTGRSGDRVALRTDLGGRVETWNGQISGSTTHDGRPAEVVQAKATSAAPAGLPATLTIAQAAQFNAGRLPLGVNAATEAATVPVNYASTVTATFWLDVQTGRVLDVRRVAATIATARFSTLTAALAEPVAASTLAASGAARTAAAAAARRVDRSDERGNLLRQLAGILGLIAVASAGTGIGFGTLWLRGRNAEPVRTPGAAPAAAPTTTQDRAGAPAKSRVPSSAS